MAGKYRLATLGCKVNQYESQQLRELLGSLGLRNAHPDESPDIAIVNTCAVTSAACSKSRQAVRRLTRGGRTAVFVVGCGVAADAERLLAIDGVVAALGHEDDVHAELRARISQILPGTPDAGTADLGTPDSVVRESQFPKNRSTKIQHKEVQPRDSRDTELHGSGQPGLSDSTHAQPQDKRYELRMNPGSNETAACDGEHRLSPEQLTSPNILSRSLPVVKAGPPAIGSIERFDGHHRAFLKVQDGCDAHCTYCIIPQLRPRLRSKPIDEAVAEAAHLVAVGHREIVVTGIFLGAYGRETAIRRRFTKGASPLAELVDALAQVPGLARLRLSSLEPGDVDEALLTILATRDACVPHLHLPLQSGSGEILRRMNRQYSAEDYIDQIDRVRAALDRPAITTDIIVGFPGETEDDFQQTLDVAAYAAFAKIHAFPFSSRSGTAAARWRKSFVEPAVVRERLQRLRDVEQASSLAYRQRAIGEVERVLIERRVHEEGDNQSAPAILSGRTDRYFDICFEVDRVTQGDVRRGDVNPGDLVHVRVDRVTPTRTHGTYCGSAAAAPQLPV